MTNTRDDRSVHGDGVASRRAESGGQARQGWLTWPLLTAMVAGLALLFFGQRAVTQTTGAVLAVAMFVAAIANRRAALQTRHRPAVGAAERDVREAPAREDQAGR
ncbi:hypothetical protein [Micromonospora carbonacea]|uniref:hypothetical protein n=1 Tax=Micromonospora carbonacea TaxID=47853 RepID=UPI003D750394